MQMVCFENEEFFFIENFHLGTILFAVTGGGVSNKKVYMIDAKTGDILTSFDSKPVNLFIIKEIFVYFSFKKFNSPHDIAVSINAREIYVAELALSPANALHKFELSKQKG
jgi:hypothetical protein